MHRIFSSSVRRGSAWLSGAARDVATRGSRGRVARAAAATPAPVQHGAARASSHAPPAGTPMVRMAVNGRPIEVAEGTSVLDACTAEHVTIPTLCFHPALPAVGKCRLCLVDVHVNGEARGLKPACVTPVQEGMEVRSETREVRASVESNLAMLRARHPNDCMTCDARGDCTLQDLLYTYQVGDKYPKVHRGGAELGDMPLDRTTPSLVRDMDKCVLCTRCIQACSHLQGMDILGMVNRGASAITDTPADEPLEESFCISCGQCSLYCPTGAITEADHSHAVFHELQDHTPRVHGATERKVTVLQTAPSVRVAIGEEFGLAAGTLSTGHMVAAARAAGFDYVVDTLFTADLTTIEEGYELLGRIKAGGPFPMFTSCCPGWVNMAEKMYPELLPHLSSCRSPQGMLGALLKTHFARRIGVHPDNVVTVSAMPCTAKKDEAERPQLTYTGADGEARPDVEYVLTTRELAKLFRMKGVRFGAGEESAFDSPFSEASGAALIYGVTGGVMESALRTAFEVYTGEALPRLELTQVRGIQADVREATVRMGDLDVNVAVANSGAALRKVVEAVKRGEKDYHFVEMMACMGGCVGGGGQPHSSERDIVRKRIQSVYDADERMVLRKAHDNAQVKQLYDDLLGEPNSHTAHELLHTHYAKHDVKGM